MFESRVNPPPRRDIGQTIIAAMVAAFGAVTVFAVVG